MLQIYDKTIAVSALALAALAASAMADTPNTIGTACDLSNGYETSASAFALEADACLKAAPATSVRSDLEDTIRTLTERNREKLAMDGFESRIGLDKAARAHAIDMASRSYVAHEDLEGRGHLHRVRTLDRSVLIGAAGANVTALPTNDGVAAFDALTSDANNMRNLSHSAFSHMGVGVAEDENGYIYVVQLFAQVDGELAEPLPASLPSISRLQANFAEAGFTPLGWELVDDNGRMLDRGLGRRIQADLAPGASAFLTIKAELNGDTYALKGPRVTGVNNAEQ